jgi:hypothetical protein
MRRRASAAIGISLLAGVGAAGTTPELRRIGTAVASSTCIGEIANPRCAAETLIACFVRQTAALCGRVGASLRQVPRIENRLIEYVIERDSVITAEQITDDLRDLEWFKPGFTLVEIRMRNCVVDCASESWENLQVYLSAHPTGWRVVSWRIDSEPEAVPELPEEFRPKAP